MLLKGSREVDHSTTSNSDIPEALSVASRAILNEQRGRNKGPEVILASLMKALASPRCQIIQACTAANCCSIWSVCMQLSMGNQGAISACEKLR